MSAKKTGGANHWDIDRWVNNGIDIKNRIVEFDDIDEISSHDIIRAIKYMDKESDKPITVIVSSFGGCVYTGLRIYDVLRDCRSLIITIGEGKVMSMGTVVYLAGDERYASANTTFMFHETSSIKSGKLSELRDDVDETSRLENITLEILAERTKRSFKWWSKAIERIDRFMDVEECKKIGVVTHEK